MMTHPTHIMRHGGDAPPPSTNQSITRNMARVHNLPPPSDRILPTPTQALRVPDDPPREQRVPDPPREQKVTADVPEQRVDGPPRTSSRCTKGQRLTPRYGYTAHHQPKPPTSAPHANIDQFQTELDTVNAELDARALDAARKRVTRVVKDHQWVKEMIRTRGAALTAKDTGRFLQAAFRIMDDDSIAMYRACRVIGLDENGQPLKWTNVIRGENKEEWINESKAE